MYAIMFAEVDWSQGFVIALFGGGGALVLTALVFFFRAMSATREESQQFESNQSIQMTSLVLGIGLILGGLYMRGTFAGGSGDSSSMSSFTEFVSKEGRFKASFPGKPKEQNQSAAGLKIKMFSVEEKEGMFGIAYCDLPSGMAVTGTQAEASLTGARKGMLQNGGAVLVKEDRIMLQGKYPGREIKADVPSKGTEMYCSIYLVDKRVYQVLIVGKSAWLDSDKARKFLNSFALR